MKIAYAFRRTTVYPYTAGFYGPGGWGLPDEPALTTFLKKINENPLSGKNPFFLDLHPLLGKLNSCVFLGKSMR